MSLSPRRLGSVLAAALVAVALSFGAAQAFASASSPAPSRSCDIYACFQWCQQYVGEGAQPYCTKYGGCGCIP